MNPLAFLDQAREQLSRYETVSLVRTKIVEVDENNNAFHCCDASGQIWRSRALLLASGLIDKLPSIPGIEAYYGTSIHHCPYCDGWENRNKAIGVIGADQAAVDLAEELLRWSDRVVLIGPTDSTPRPVHTKKVEFMAGLITGLDGEAGKLKSLILHDGTRRPMDALFFSPAQVQHADIARKLGCAFEEEAIRSDDHCQTRKAGLFVAGNVSKGMQLAIVAAADGVKAGAAINAWLADQGLR
jgi:thioredoxin reductase